MTGETNGAHSNTSHEFFEQGTWERADLADFANQRVLTAERGSLGKLPIVGNARASKAKYALSKIEYTTVPARCPEINRYIWRAIIIIFYLWRCASYKTAKTASDFQ